MHSTRVKQTCVALAMVELPLCVEAHKSLFLCAVQANNHFCIGQEKDTTGSGWEGSAILHHGSVLQFGCYSFTFSVIDWLKPPSDDCDTANADHITPVVVKHGGDGDDTDVQMEEAA